MQKKNSWPGGIILCVFPALILLLAHHHLPLWGVALFSLLILNGVGMIITRIFKLDAENPWSCLVNAVSALGFAVFAFLVAYSQTDKWGGGIPFISHGSNQMIARILFVFGGLLALVVAVVFLKKAVKKRDRG